MSSYERIKKHLIDYREKNALTQMDMAVLLNVSLRTYQSIEATGNPVKADTLMTIIEQTGLDFKQIIAVKSTEDFMSSVTTDLAAIKVAIAYLTQKAIESQVASTGLEEEVISREYRKKMKEAYDLFLDKSDNK